MTTVPTIKLNNGIQMPVFGLGTYLAKQRLCEESVKNAIDVGYRHIDTAFFYGNEVEVGRAVRAKIDEGIIRREDVFICTKLWNSFHAPKLVEMACRKSMENLNLGQIDLYLMHNPMGYAYSGTSYTEMDLLPKDADGNIKSADIDYLDTWKAMEKLYDTGLVRALGVSNFNSEQLNRIIREGRCRPVTNQIEVSANFAQKKLRQFCNENNIIVTAYGPLGRPYRPTSHNNILTAIHDPRIADIAKKYHKSPAQILLRHLIQIGTVPIPKSSNPQRILENIQIFDFELSNNDLTIIEELDMNLRSTTFSLCKNHKYFPFNIEF